MVDLPGYYPVPDGEGVHVGDDMAAADAALRVLKEKIDGVPAPETIRRVRTNSNCRSAKPGPCSRSARMLSTNMNEA